jgi:hypothetical protein
MALMRNGKALVEKGGAITRNVVMRTEASITASIHGKLSAKATSTATQ